MVSSRNEARPFAPLMLAPSAGATEAQIARVEATIGHRFPDDYRRFLAEVNGGSPRKSCYRGPREEFYLQHMYAIEDPTFIGNHGLESALETRRTPRRMFRKLIPIGFTGSNNSLYICMRRGDVYVEIDGGSLRGVASRFVDLFDDLYDSFDDDEEEPDPLQAELERITAVVRDGSDDDVQKEIDALGDIDAEIKGLTLTAIAIREHATGRALELLARGASHDGLLYQAVNAGEVEVVAYLVDHGADPKAEIDSPFGGNALEVASFWGHLEVVELLLDHGAEASGKAAHKALCDGHDDLARLLLDNGAEAWSPILREFYGL